MIKMFYEDLSKNSKFINWKESIGNWVKFIYGNIEGKVKIVDYDGKHLYVKYLDGEPFKILVRSFKECRLGTLLGKITSEFKIEIGQIISNDKMEFAILDREYRPKKDKNGWTSNLKFYNYRCLKCGYEGWKNEGDINNGYGCPVCCSNPHTVAEGINDIYSQEPWMIKFFQDPDEAKLYTPQSSKKLYFKCPDCGRIKNKAISISKVYKNKSISCICNDGTSYPNKFMFNVLDQLNIEFKPEFSPKWIGRKLYDFYIPSKNIIIEMDGGLGHGKKTHSKSNKTAKETKADDDYKDLMAEQHGIKVIRINCDESNIEFIKDNILESELIDYFDFSNIDWLRVEEFALKNRVKVACELKRDNPDLLCKEIGEMMKLGISTINLYLKKGSKIWDWCEYNPKEEWVKSAIKTGKTRGKQVEIFKNGISLGIFDSCKELEMKSEALFGIKLTSSCISQCCNNKLKKHKGFVFKYVEKQNNNQSA